jgi:hypothetical protein
MASDKKKFGYQNITHKKTSHSDGKTTFILKAILAFNGKDSSRNQKLLRLSLFFRRIHKKTPRTTSKQHKGVFPIKSERLTSQT